MKKLVPVALLAIAALAGCYPTPVSQTITDKQRLEFEEACNLLRGDYYHGQPWGTPSCRVTFVFPSIPTNIDGSVD